MNKSLFFGLVAILGLIGCSRNQEIDVPDANLSLFARTESPADTKTVVEDGVHVYWEPGDEIAVFMGEKAAKFTTDITAASGTASFKGSFGDATSPDDLDLWAVYPFSEDAVFDGETITTTLPSEQVAREGSFGKDMNLAIAHSSGTTLPFYNVGGGIRFSVTEEGIKKVMFEGLSGEIITGKVKIGLDENGKPVVKEVTGGSQFITLLPPSGKETFEKDTWYYIVAIPGALEGGYKLRFYKDSDYARKVSEKAVTIKRSIFGNIEKADMGIEYEAQTTHFPETAEEWEASIELTAAVHKEINSLIWGENADETKEINELVEDIKQIDGVIFAAENEDQSSIAVIQKDSLCVNYMLYSRESSDINPTEQADGLSLLGSTPQKALLQSKASNGKNALILAPFQWDFKDDIEGAWIPCLSKNYADRIHYLPDNQAGFLQFRDELQQQYDCILISTHGTTGYRSHPTTVGGFYTEINGRGSYLATSTVYSKSTVKELVENNNVNIKQMGIISPPNNAKEYLSISKEILDDASFDNSCVIISACESAKQLSGTMPWLDTFTSKGALCVSGAKVDMHSGILGPMVTKLIEIMTIGCSFRDSFYYVTKSTTMSHLSQSLYEYHHSQNPKREYESYDVSNNYIYKQNESKPTQDFYLSNPSPSLETVAVNNDSVVFPWVSHLSPFPQVLRWHYSVDTQIAQYTFKDITYQITYEVYLDDQLIGSAISQDSSDRIHYSITASKPLTGDHEWKVIAKIIEEESGNIIGAYSSSEGYFTITDEQQSITPEAIDLGLSVKWANLNVGANSPEKSGDYFAWGETEPYYQSLRPLVWRVGKESGYEWSSYKWWTGDEDSLAKYNQNDRLTFLEMEDDAARQKLGGKWRTPSSDEWEELRKNCTWTWTTRGGISGFNVSSKQSDAFIFLPAAGLMVGTVLFNHSEKGMYASSTLVESQWSSALAFEPQWIGRAGYARYWGYSIRPVVPYLVSGVSLNKTAVTLSIGASEALTATISPENVTDKEVYWASSNAAVATVTNSGLVKGVGEGTAIVTVTTVDDGHTATCVVTVVVPVTSVSLNSTSLSILAGESRTLVATVEPANATNRNVTWSSSNPLVAAVSENGTVTGISAGSATITVRTVDGGRTASCNVTVKEPIPVREVDLDRTSVELVVGETCALIATVSPADALDKTITWSCDDISVAQVREGVIVAIGVGTTKIHATHIRQDGLVVEGICDVTVKFAGGSHEGTGEEEW